MNVCDLKNEIKRRKQFRTLAKPDALAEIKRICLEIIKGLEIIQENDGSKIHLTLSRGAAELKASEVLTLPWRPDPESETGEYLDVVRSEENKADLDFLIDFVAAGKEDPFLSPEDDVFPKPNGYKKSGVYISIAKSQPGYYDD